MKDDELLKAIEEHFMVGAQEGDNKFPDDHYMARMHMLNKVRELHRMYPRFSGTGHSDDYHIYLMYALNRGLLMNLTQRVLNYRRQNGKVPKVHIYHTSQVE